SHIAVVYEQVIAFLPLTLFTFAVPGTMRGPVPDRSRSGAAMHVRLLRPVFFVLAFVATARADGPAWPVPRGPARNPAPVTYDPAAQKALPAGFFDDAPACVLFSGTTNRLL